MKASPPVYGVEDDTNAGVNTTILVLTPCITDQTNCMHAVHSCVIERPSCLQYVHS